MKTSELLGNLCHECKKAILAKHIGFDRYRLAIAEVCTMLLASDSGDEEMRDMARSLIRSL